MHDSHEPEIPDELDDELNDGLELAFGAGSEPLPSPSVLGRIAELTGSEPKITLRDTASAGDTPMLKPLGPEDRVEAGKYVVQGELGSGGVGAVHRGHDQDLGRDVAMKFLHEKYKNEPAILHRFVEEAQIGGQLQHPGIVPVYDLGMVNGKPFFAMKLVKGVTLAKKLSDRKSVASDRRSFLSIFEDVCQTMAYAHARGVVHRDLKPANIMIGAFGEVQVVDWGMGKVLQSGGTADEARAVERQAELSVIETRRSSGEGTQSIMGSVMGTPAYMPPEQARGDVSMMDERSDVFALGAILCEILTGQPPYVGAADELISMAAMCRQGDAHARLAASGADAMLVELVTSCLMPAQAARPQSGETVAAAIHEYLAVAEQRLHAAEVQAIAHKRTQAYGIALTSVIAVALVVSLLFWRSASDAAERESQARGQAERSAVEERAARTRAEGHRLAARADVERAQDSALALNLAIAGYERAEDHYTRNALVRVLSDLREVHTLGRHEHYVTAIRSSPDGRYVAAIGHMKYATVWDVESGARAFLLDAHDGEVVDIAYSPGGARIATASKDATVRLWRARDGQIMRVLSGHVGGASNLHWTKDGSQLVTASAAGTIRVWDADTGATLSSFGTGGPIEAIEVSPDDASVAILSTDSVRIFQLRTGRRVHEFQRPEPSEMSEEEEKKARMGSRLTFLADGRRLLFWWTRPSIVWDCVTGDEVARYEGTVCPSADGKQLVWTDGSETVVRDTASNRELYRYGAVRGEIVAFSPARKLLVSVEGAVLRVFDARDGKERGQLIGHAYGVHRREVLIHDSDTVISCSNDMTVRVWRTRPLFRIGTLGEGYELVDANVSPYGAHAVVTRHKAPVEDRDPSSKPSVDLVELPGGKVVAELTAAADYVTYVPKRPSPTWSSDGQLLAHFDFKTEQLRLCRSVDGSILWSVPSLPETPGQARRVGRRLVFSPDCSKLLEQRETTVVLRDVATGAVVHEYPPFPENAYCLRWSRDGRSLFSADLGAGSATERNAETGAAVRVFGGQHSGWVVAAVPSPSGALLATTAADGTVSLWDLPTGKHVHRFVGLKQGTLAIDFGPRGDFLFVTCRDDDTRVLDVRRRVEHCRLPHQRWSQPTYFLDGRVLLIDKTGEVLAFPLDVLARARELRPRLLTSQEFLAFDLGDNNSALAAHNEELAIFGFNLAQHAWNALVAVHRGELERARAVNARLRLLRPRGGMVDLVRAAILVREGDHDAAFAALEDARSAGCNAENILRRAPPFAPLRSDKRWAAIVRNKRR